VAAEREIITKQNLQQPAYVVQMEELAALAKNCGYRDLAMQFAMADLGSSDGQYSIPQTQQRVAAEIWLERGDAAKAAEILEQLRASRNAKNSPTSFILEIKSLLLSGQYERASQVNLSRWMRPLSVTRFYRGPYYSKAVGDLMDQGDLTAAREYADLAFQLSEFGSMDFYWAAADLSRLLEEKDDFAGSADALRAPLVEALTPGASQLEFQVRNHHIHFLRNAIKRERIHRAAACIDNGELEAAKRHIEVGMKLQPQDIEMVVACYPRLSEVGQTQVAEWLFETYESAMLKQLEIWPNDAMALNNLAWMYAKCERKLDEALKLAHRAVSLAPGSAVYLDTLAEVHFRDGRIEAAIAAMKECIRMDPREKHYLENLERFSQAGQ
jgi:tetratricopeptide (TPR) repeat protein